jgi:hypothetical protein
MCTVCHGVGGIFDILSGTGGWAGAGDAGIDDLFHHGINWWELYFLSNQLLIVLVEPWWPSWARSMACFLRDVGITIRVDFRSRSLSLLTVLIGFYLHKCWNVVSSKCW